MANPYHLGAMSLIGVGTIFGGLACSSEPSNDASIAVLAEEVLSPTARRGSSTDAGVILPAATETGMDHPRCAATALGRDPGERRNQYWPSGRYYAYEVLNTAAPYHARDGARLHYLPSTGRHWLMGGWWPLENDSWGTDVTTNEVWSTSDFFDWQLDLAHDHDPPISGVGARWQRRHTFASVVFNDNLWVIGGDASFASPWPTDIWKSGDGVTWTRVLERAPWRPKYLAIAATYGGAMYFMGGFDFDTLEASSEMWKSYDGSTWERLPDMPFKRAGAYSGVVLCGRLYIIGGSSGPQSGRTLHNDTWAWDGTRWTQVSTSAGWIPRDYNATVAYDGKLWVMNGAAPGDTRDTWYSEDLGASWRQLEGSPWYPSHADGVVVTPQGIVLATGHQLSNAVYRIRAVDP